MISSLLARQKHRHETLAALDEGIRASLLPLVAFAVIAVWAWITYVLTFRAREHAGAAYVCLILLAGTMGSAVWLHRRYLKAAVAAYISGLLLIVTWIIFSLADTAAIYLYIPIVLVAATLTGARVTWLVALACGALAVLLRFTAGLPIATGTLTAMAVALLLTTLGAVLNSRRLLTALDWTLTMTREAERNAEEARTHRAELQQVLKSLDIAYVRLERANRDLIFAHEATEKAYRFKAEFVANVSHELRTPLNLIIGFSEMMATAPESYGSVPLPGPYRGDVAAIYQSARHLSDLIDDVLDLSQIEAGRMPLIKEQADLAPVIREAIDMVRGLAETRRVQLHVALPDNLPILRLDRTRIRQVLLNLLTNAARFTDTGWIRVQVERRAQEVAVTVKDTGRGIPAEKLSAAFQAFSQLHEDPAPEGTGLGLAVSQKFVELHGGRMWITSEIGKGTEVGFTLPLQESNGHTSAVELRSLPAPHRYSERLPVLVLHEDSRVVSLLNRHVPGYQFTLAHTPAVAATALQEVRPAAVIVDTGWLNRWTEASTELDLRRVPRIACPLPDIHHMSLLVGARDFLSKPITRKELQDTLAHLVKPVHTVLVIDDDAHMVRLLARMLKAINPALQILRAYDGREGMEVALAQRPDVVLLDLSMPEMTGQEFLAQLQHEPALAETQVIVVSVRSVEQETAQLQGDLRLALPNGFSPTALLALLEALLPFTTAPDSLDPAAQDGAARASVPAQAADLVEPPAS